MKDAVLRLFVKGEVLIGSLKNEEGQDLIEYALVVALVAFAATAGMSTLAKGINNAFTQIATTLASYVT
jgi:pilus assembly protein Flp/PilA